MFKRVLLIVATSLITACTPGIDGLVHDKSLTLESLQQGGISIAGLGAKSGVLNQGHQDTYSELLRQALEDDLKGIAIVSENELLHAIRREDHALIVEEFSRRGTLSAININRLKNKLNTRYVALTQIDSNTVKNERSNQLESIDRNGKVLRPASTTSKSTRTVYARLYLFDLRSGKRVWGGSIHLSRNSSRSYGHDNTAVNLIRGISALSSGMDSAYPYPQAPSEGELLNSIFSAFAENLGKLK
ncbi:MAG: hypothetical protein OEX12_10395 [Gammaproteobacteria bacterium]|nr:hypothetical protein [Gammaproteobacteria bacterium]